MICLGSPRFPEKSRQRTVRMVSPGGEPEEEGYDINVAELPRGVGTQEGEVIGFVLGTRVVGRVRVETATEIVQRVSDHLRIGIIVYWSDPWHAPSFFYPRPRDYRITDSAAAVP